MGEIASIGTLEGIAKINDTEVKTTVEVKLRDVFKMITENRLVREAFTEELIKEGMKKDTKNEDLYQAILRIYDLIHEKKYED